MLRRIKLRRRRLRLLLPLLALCSLLAGCGASDGGGGNGDMQSYGHDGYMGLQNSSPGMPIQGSAQHYSDDGKFAGELLRPLRGIRDVRVVFDGAVMRVNLMLDPALSREEAARLTARAERLLGENFPRYRVEVSSVH